MRRRSDFIGSSTASFDRERVTDMRKKKRIVCGVLLAVVIGVGALTVWQWNNINAALSFVRFSQEELEEKLEANDQAIKDAVEANPSVTIREVTEEERAALRDGTLTQEELVQSLMQKPEPGPEQPSKPQTTPQQTKPEQKPADESRNTPQSQPNPEPEKSEYEQKVNALIAEVFVLREEFLIKLDNLKAAAIADYRAIPVEERNAKALMSLASGYIAKGLDMEKQCDARIEAIVVELEQVLQENNGDLSIAQTVYDTYVEEKSLKKAWYMAELKKVGAG